MLRRTQGPIDIACRSDERKMGERLWGIARRLTARSDFCGVESKLNGVPKHLLEDQPRRVHLAGMCQRLHEPEHARAQGTFFVFARVTCMRRPQPCCGVASKQAHRTSPA